MPDSNLLNIDPDVLFQQHSISEIGDIQKKLLHEIERKKEELRIMVGERYRDLIEAADTIADMKTTASNCINHIDEMTVTCRKLHDSHLIGFKNDKIHPSIERPIINKNMHGIATQIKLLMIIPEQIWSFVDAEDFLSASQLFLFSRHIYIGLQLAAGGQNANSNVSNLMPMIHRQLSSISNFNESLKRACQKKLGNDQLTAEVAASCLASLYLLDNDKSLVELMNIFITLHSKNSICTTLNKDVDSSFAQGNIKTDIKERISLCVSVIVKTLQLLYNCFVENNEGLILHKLNGLYKNESKPLISLVNFDDPIGLKMLPPIVSEYRLKSFKELKPLNKEEIFSCVSSWMDWVQKYSAERVELLLKYVNSAKSLQSIREKAMCIDTPNNWIEICNALLNENKGFDIWLKYFQPIITERLKILITTKWTDVVKSFKENIHKLLDNITKLSSNEKEININWFVWNDLISQSFITSEENIINSVNSMMKSMSLQDRGFTPNLEKICEDLDKDLRMMLDDLNEYLYIPQAKNASSIKEVLLEDDSKISNIDILGVNQKKYFDRSEVENHLKNCTKENIQNIIKFINEECIGKAVPEDNFSIYLKSASILSARFLQALPILVPNLKFCFIPSQIASPSLYEDYNTTDPNIMNTWESICKMLHDNCEECWMHWIKDAENRINELLKHMPQDFTLASNIDYMSVQWDAINIEEKDDQDQVVTSTIKIPSGPSIKLQEFTYSSSRILDEVVPHTLPKKIHLYFIEMVSVKILHYFSTIIKEKSAEINQKCALQLLMDVRHITLLLVSRENKNLLSESQATCDLLREKIDPFDYNVFYPKLQVNIKRSVQRVQTLFGSLIPNNDQLNSIIGTKPLVSGGTADRDPNTFILASQGSTTVTWFPLLPVTAPMSNKKPIEKQRKKQLPINSQVVQNLTQEIPVTTAPGSTNTVRSGAAAFFGSMASDWFGNYNQ